MPQLIDFSQIAISCATVFPEDMKKGQDTKKMTDIIRHVTLKSLITYKKNYGATYGDLVLCCDSNTSWRKQKFKYYKAHRKAGKEASDLDWNAIMEGIEGLKSDLRELFPYKMIEVNGAEGDDCIAGVTQWLQDNDLVTEGLYEEVQPILVVSSDHDFKQLHKFRSVKQWSPMQKMYVPRPPSPEEFLVEKIITGDKGDGVPSVLMEDDFFVNGVGRAKSVTKGVLEKYKDYASLSAEEKVRYDRNKLMIDFDSIPPDIYNEIIDRYKEAPKARNLGKIFTYLSSKRCRELIERIEDF